MSFLRRIFGSAASAGAADLRVRLFRDRSEHSLGITALLEHYFKGHIATWSDVFRMQLPLVYWIDIYDRFIPSDAYVDDERRNPPWNWQPRDSRPLLAKVRVFEMPFHAWLRVVPRDLKDVGSLRGWNRRDLDTVIVEKLCSSAQTYDEWWIIEMMLRTLSSRYHHCFKQFVELCDRRKTSVIVDGVKPEFIGRNSLALRAKEERDLLYSLSTAAAIVQCPACMTKSADTSPLCSNCGIRLLA